MRGPPFLGLFILSCATAASVVVIAVAMAMPLLTPRPLTEAERSAQIAEALERWARSAVVAGEGTMQSESFRLDGGDYLAYWEATDGPCYNGLALYSDADGNRIGTIAMTEVRSTGNGFVRIHGLARGAYYIDAASGCRWSVRLTARP